MFVEYYENKLLPVGECKLSDIYPITVSGEELAKTSWIRFQSFMPRNWKGRLRQKRGVELSSK